MATVADYAVQYNFDRQDIREEFIAKGLLIEGKEITAKYSRGIVSNLLKEGFIEKVSRGVYVRRRFIKK